MIRIAMIAAHFLFAAAPMAQAQVDDAECAVQIEVVMAVADARKDGAPMQTATQDVSAALSGDAGRYAAIVPDIAAWIYTLPSEQLTDALGQSWQDQVCAAQ